jgi:beta-mannanase
MTARDYAAMFRHTVRRLRADGVTNVVFVMVYMAYEPWCEKDWFADLYPGDDVVDWIGMDPYLFARPGRYGYGDFAYLVDHTSNPAKWPGFYSWVTAAHGNKPLMVAEWGVYEHDPAQKAWIFSTVARQIGRFPAIRALVYFDSPNAPKGDTRPDSSQPALSEFKKLAESAVFSVTL